MKRHTWAFFVVGIVYVGLSSTERVMGDSDKSVGEKMQRIDAEIVVSASLDDVWHAWTTNEGIQTFFSPKSNVKLEIGGPYEMLFDSQAAKGKQGSEGCNILSYLPREMLSFSWSAPPQFEHAREHRTWVVVRFEELGERVRVRIAHLGWQEMKAAHGDYVDEWQQVFEYFSGAWPFVLDNLKKRFDEGPRWG